MDDPLIGKQLGDYTIQSLLGRGGMSRVYKGYDENLQRYAAVKVISGDFATTTEEEYTRRFTSEARAIAHLRHTSIVGVYQFGRTEGIYYMAQVFLEGKDLRQLLKEYADKGQRMPGAEVVRIVSDVAGALDYAHEQGVIHRDIKPSNIMLEKRTGRAILMDFGLALSVHEGTMGDTFGSAHYIAPEQAVSSAKAVAQSDLYSLGIVIYEMVTGKVPFDDPSVMSVALKHLNEMPPPPTMYNPDLPVGVEAVIMRTLDKDPARRYETGALLVAELENAFAGGEVEPVGRRPAVVVDETLRPITTESSLPRPQISKPSKPVGELAGGLVGRFARRKARRDEEAALEAMGEAGFEIDDDTLGSLLDSMPDPSEIGLVGEQAKGITPRPQRYTPESNLPLARMLGEAEPPSEVEALEPEEKRRSRWKIVLPLLLMLGVLLAALYYSPQFAGDEDGEGGGENEVSAVQTETAKAERTALAIVALTQTAEVTVESTSTPTGEPTVTATGEPTSTPTGEPTSEATQTSGPEVTEATDTPTATPESTEMPAEVATAVAMADLPPIYKPNIRLIYNNEELLLLNVSGDTLDISQLSFEQIMPDGKVRTFQTTTWDDVIDPPGAMRKDSCYQLLTRSATQGNPDPDVCMLFQGYFRSNLAERYFWVSDDPDAVFAVRIAGESGIAASCKIAAGECEFYAGPQEDAEPIEPTGAPPEVAEQDPNIRLIYNRETFVLVNISDETLDISNLLFEQELPTGSARVFLAAEWDEADLVDQTTSMRAGGCFELVASEGTWFRPEDEVCSTFLGWFRSNLSERYFWRSTQSGMTFMVRVQDNRTPLAICEIDASECEFYMPPSEPE